MDTTLDGIARAVIEGDAARAERLTEQALRQGVLAADILHRSLIPGMTTVGEKMQAGEYYIPEVLLSAKAMKVASAMVTPLIASGGARTDAGRVVLGTVKGDLHDIGKNLVGMMLQGTGFEVIDLGLDVPAERFVSTVLEVEPEIVGLSALITITMVGMKNVIQRLAEAGCRDRVKIMVGGAPVTQRFADEIGADGYASSAAAAVTLARRLVGPVGA